MRRHILYILMLFMPCIAIAQSDRQLIREGNKLYRNGDYAKAELSYRKAIEKNGKNTIATYNLGCAMMRQNNDSSAIETFANAAAMTSDKTIRAKANHNTGTILQHKKQYKEAIEAYKEALRNNPKDNDSRYNLILCKHLLKKQQQQQQQQQNKQNQQDKDNKKNDDDKDKNKQDKDKDKKKDNEQDKNDNQNNNQKRQMSRENAEQLLNAAMQQEKETQKKLKKAMQQPSRRQFDKNW